MTLFLDRLLRLTGACSLICAVIVVVGLYYAGKWLPLMNEPEPAEAIVILGGSFFRTAFAADLYLQGLAPRVYVSKAYRDRHSRFLESLGVSLPREEDISLEILLKKGVPRRAITVFGTSNLSTAQEAIELRTMFAGTSQRILLVTSAYHVRRTSKVFRDICEECKFLVVGTPYEPFYQKWWTDRESATSVVLESVKWLFYLAGGRFINRDDALLPSSQAKQALETP